jgi:hypothetical protein
VETERGYAGGEFGGDRITAAAPRAARWPAAPVPVTREHARAAALALAALIVLSVIVRTVLAWRIPTPWIMVDELLYSELAKSFAERGELLIRELEYGRLSLVYPIVIAPAWLADEMATTYGLAKVINALVMSLAAVPVYLWARRLVSPTLALVAAGLALLLPDYVYTGTLMTENAFFPAFLLAAFALALALERPTLLNQGLALGAAGFATAVRVQGIVLFAILIAAVVLKVLFDLRARAGRPLELTRPYVPMVGTILAAALAYVGLKVAQGGDLASGLGSYAGVRTNYDYGEAGQWILRHAAELGLLVGVAPLAAALLLVGLAAFSGLPGPAERAFVAVALPAVVLVVIQVGTYASRFSFRIQERNMFHVAPILLLALIVWLARGAPRPPVLATAAALASALLLLALPLRSLLNQSITSDTFALIPLLRLDQLVDDPRPFMLAGGLAAALAFLVLPRAVATIVLPAAIAVYLVVATNSVLGAVADYSKNLRTLVPAQASWVDERIGADAEAPYLFGTTADPFREAVALWQLEFWNRSIAGVYGLGVPPQAGIPELEASFDRTTGRIVSSSPGLEGSRYVVTQTGLDLAERRLEAAGEAVLYAVDEPLLVGRSIGGVFADGWMGPDATYDRYSGKAGTLTVSLSREAWRGPDKPGRVVIEVGPIANGPDNLPTIDRVTARREWTIHSRSQRTFRLRTPKPPFRARIQIEPTFSPAEYGQGDTRQLGAQVAFGFAPTR